MHTLDVFERLRFYLWQRCSNWVSVCTAKDMKKMFFTIFGWTHVWSNKIKVPFVAFLFRPIKWKRVTFTIHFLPVFLLTSRLWIRIVLVILEPLYILNTICTQCTDSSWTSEQWLNGLSIKYTPKWNFIQCTNEYSYFMYFILCVLVHFILYWFAIHNDM